MAQKYSFCGDYPQMAKGAIAEMVKQTGPCVFDDDGVIQKGTIVRVLVLPGYTEEAKKVMSQWKDTYFDHYGYDEIEFYKSDSVYLTAKVYKGMFIPTAVYKDNVKVIEIAAKK